MTWWRWVLSWIARRVVRYTDDSWTVVDDPKKSPPQAEAGAGIEYGGHHLP